MAEWLRSGLQNRLPRFNSGRGLQAFSLSRLPEGIHPLLHEAGFQSRRGFVIGNRAYAEWASSFPGSSAVEQPAVNRLVAGSNPARGAKYFKNLASQKMALKTIGVRSGYSQVKWISPPRVANAHNFGSAAGKVQGIDQYGSGRALLA